jgi:hypothetical protein
MFRSSVLTILRGIVPMQSYYPPVAFVTTLVGDVAVFSARAVVLFTLLLLVLLYTVVVEWSDVVLKCSLTL